MPAESLIQLIANGDAVSVELQRRGKMPFRAVAASGARNAERPRPVIGGQSPSRELGVDFGQSWRMFLAVADGTAQNSKEQHEAYL